MTLEDLEATPVDRLTAPQLRAELTRTRTAFASYVQAVGSSPQAATDDLPPDARRHLEVQEAIDRLDGTTAVAGFVAEGT